MFFMLFYNKVDPIFEQGTLTIKNKRNNVNIDTQFI